MTWRQLQSCSSLVRLDVSFIPPDTFFFIIKMSEITAPPQWEKKRLPECRFAPLRFIIPAD